MECRDELCMTLARCSLAPPSNSYVTNLESKAYLQPPIICLTQKDFAGEKERIFLINRTEHPRLAERVRCLCVGCDVTWGPPCQALLTQLPANRRRRAENNRLTQNSNSHTINTAHNRF